MNFVSSLKTFQNKENKLDNCQEGVQKQKARAFGKSITNISSNITNKLKKIESNPTTASSNDQEIREVESTKRIENPQRFEIYKPIIFDFLKKEHQSFSRENLPIKNQEEINDKMRSILIDWLVDISENFKVSNKTLFLTIDLIDRFIEVQQIKKSQLQLVGIACLMIACKFQEIYPPQSKDFLFICDGAFDKQQLLKMEGLIMQKLNFDLNRTNSLELLDFIKDKINFKKKQFDFLHYMLETFMLEGGSGRYSSLEQITGAIFLIHKIFKLGNWQQSDSQLNEVSDRRMKLCARDLFLAMKKMEKSDYMAIKKKFAQDKYSEVSKFKIEQKKQLIHQKPLYINLIFFNKINIIFLQQNSLIQLLNLLTLNYLLISTSII